MHKTLNRRLLAAAPLALAAGLLTTSSALAYRDIADLKAMDFTTQSLAGPWINVVSNSKQKWDAIEPGEVTFGAHVMIDTRHYVYWHGIVDHVGIILGTCENSSCSGKPLLWMRSPKTNDYENQTTITFPTSKIPVSSSGGLATVPYGDDILARCNAGERGKEHSFVYDMHATFAADTSMISGTADSNAGGTGDAETPATWTKTADHTLSKPFVVAVRCKPFEPAVSTSTRDPNPDPHRVKPVATRDIDLFLTTVIPPPAAQHGPSGTQCKPLKVTTRIETDKAGPVPVKLWRQVNGGPITSEQKQMTAEALAAGKFGDDWNKVEHFTQTTTVQYKAEVLGGTFAPSTPWKSITIHCNGDFAPTTNGAPNDPPRGKPQVQLPPAVAMPPPLCGTQSALLHPSVPCIKTAPVPDQRKQAAEEKRRAAELAELRRREAALKANAMRQPPGFVRPAGPARFMGPARPARGFVMSPALILK